jgi:hypothetical protein
VPNNPFGYAPTPVVPRQTAYTPAPVETAARVDMLGRRIVAANRERGLEPAFWTIGAPQAEIFHQGTSKIVITDGLAKQCTTDGQLAAVLCSELGKMISEREAAAGVRARVPERSPPLGPPVGGDHGGAFGAADQLQRAELAKYEQERERKIAVAAASAPDPKTVARDYLVKAGFAPTELEGVASLLKAAGEQNSFAKQLGTVPERSSE